MSYYNFYAERIPELTGKDPEQDYLSLHCPFHDDANASASLNLKNGRIWCHACHTNYSPQQFLQLNSDLTAEEAQEIIEQFKEHHSITTNDFSKASDFSKLPMPSSLFTALYNRSQELMDEFLPIVQEYMITRRIKYETLRALEVGFLPWQEIFRIRNNSNKWESKQQKALEDYLQKNKLTLEQFLQKREVYVSGLSWLKDSLVFSYTRNGRVVGIKYRDIDGNKGGELGSHLALWQLDKLDENCKTAIICEGESDALKAYQACEGKYIVLATPTAIFKKEWVREFEGVEQVFLIPQDDEPSLRMAQQAKTVMPRVFILNLQWSKKEIGKDVADWLRYHTDHELFDIVADIVAAKSRTVQSWEEFSFDACVPREWLINELFSRQQIMMIGGRAKSRKTYLALNLVRSLLLKENFLNLDQFFVTDDPLNILFWEEEGAAQEIYERVDKLFNEEEKEELKKHFWIAHQLGAKIDDEEWLKIILSHINEKNIDVIIFDPFARMFMKNENDAGEMGYVWNNLAQLIRKNPKLSIVMLHHFHKAAELENGLEALRGSGKSSAEIDVCINIDKKLMSKGGGNRVRFEGRIKDVTNNAGLDILDIKFDADTGKMFLEEGTRKKPMQVVLDALFASPTGEISLLEMVELTKMAAGSIVSYCRRWKNPRDNKLYLLVTKENGVDIISFNCLPENVPRVFKGNLRGTL